MPDPARADAVADVEAATQQWISAFNRKNAKDIVARVYQLRDGKWMIVNHHSSAMPAPQS